MAPDVGTGFDGNILQTLSLEYATISISCTNVEHMVVGVCKIIRGLV